MHASAVQWLTCLAAPLQFLEPLDAHACSPGTLQSSVQRDVCMREVSLKVYAAQAGCAVRAEAILHRWWQPSTLMSAAGRPSALCGKPPVPFRRCARMPHCVPHGFHYAVPCGVKAVPCSRASAHWCQARFGQLQVACKVLYNMFGPLHLASAWDILGSCL